MILKPDRRVRSGSNDLGPAPDDALAATVHALLAADADGGSASAYDVAATLRRIVDNAGASSMAALDASDAGSAGADKRQGSVSHPSRPETAERSDLGPRDPLLLLAYGFLAEQVQAIQQNAPVALAGRAPEGVHQLRVATRRIRAALKAFGRFLPREPTRRFRTDFRWLARALGEVRDLDVYRDRLRGQSGLLDPALRSALGPFEHALEQQHAVARAELARSLASERYEQLIRDFARWVDRGPSAAAWRRWSSLSIRDGAPDYIDAAIRRVRKCGRRIDADSPPGELHDLRIRAKRLRYLTEIFTPVYGKSLSKRLQQVRRLQDTLGAYQDACVAVSQLEARCEQLRARPAATCELQAIEKLREVEQASAAAARKRFARNWPRFVTQFDRAEIRRILSHSSGE